ncbi:MAG TPA: TonB-dependent receptor [Steroidobacteraceae bacterium]|jgi:outer membrane receptor protein involved in Fe transport|nr:TonB-dependent receptor [Steroidobacteraceae bacterium]
MKIPSSSHPFRGVVATAASMLLSIAGAGAAFAAAPASNTKAPSDSSGLEEIVVTAEKRDSTVQATPIAITALSAGDLAQENIQTVEDLVGAVPGVSMRSAGPGQTEYEMRGLTSAGGSAATVGYYIDETPLSASAVALNGRTVIDADLFDLSHVEVLRGPQGTLYGSGSMGGTIKLVTNQPKIGVFEGATDVSLSQTSSGGSTNGSVSAMVNLPVNDIMAVRLVATQKYISGWIPRVVAQEGEFPYPVGFGTTCFSYCPTRGNVGAAPVAETIKGSNLEKFTAERALLLLKPTDELTINGTLMYQRIDAQGYNNYQATGTSPDPYPSTPGIYQPNDVKEPYYDSFKLASLTVKYSFGFADLTSATGYWQRYVFQSTDATEALQNINGLAGSASPTPWPNGFLPGLLYDEEDPTTQISEELRLTSNGTGPLQWVGGIYASDLHSGYITHNETPYIANAYNSAGPGAGNINNGGAAANPDGVIFNDNNPNIMKQSAVFGEASYKVTDDLKATLGVRYFKFTVANTSHQCGVGTGTGNATCQEAAASGSGNNVLPKLNISYTPTPDLTLYGTVSKGSRPGGVNLPIPLPTLSQIQSNPLAYNCGIPNQVQLNPGTPIPAGTIYVTSQPSYFAPDSIWSYELGEKARFDDRRFTLDADVYYVKWKNIQQVIDLSCGYPYSTNAGNALAYGPEVEATALIVEGLTFSVSGAWTKAYINQPSINEAAVIAGATPGTDPSRVVNVPRYTADISLEYQRDIGNDLTGLFRIADSIVGPIEDISYVRETLPSHAFLDARAGVSHGQWAAYLVGTNLTNKIAALTIDNTTFAWQQPTIIRVSTNQPRTVGVDFQYKF